MASVAKKGAKKPARKKAEPKAKPNTATPAAQETKPEGYVFGRPTLYRPAMCQQVVLLGVEGKSRAQIARTLGVDRGTLKEWEKTHADFSRAMSIAAEFAQAWWEDKGQLGVDDKSFNGHVFSFQMKNRFRHDYSDKFEIKHDGTAAFLACLKKMNGASA